MTPEELDVIAADGAHVADSGASFATRFYDTLFEIAPDTRALFPEDLTAQRGKLVDELEFLIAAAAAARGSGGLAPFVERARDLGRRHVGYGVSGADYGPVGAALIAALRATVPDWDGTHEAAWSKLYRLIADVMREGAAEPALDQRG